MKRLLLVLVVALPLFAQVADGDRHYAARADGAVGDRARSEQIDAAIAAYQRATVQSGSNLEPHWKLLRAYRFKGAYVAANNEEKKKVYAVAKAAGQHAMKMLDQQLVARGLAQPAKASEKQYAAAASPIAGAGELLLWDAINWGEWALAYGKIAAARQGAADRIKRQATIAMLIDPSMEAGSPARVLGRLHDQTPRIPFLTGWASSKEAIRFLNDSLRIDTTNKLTIVFLAEAMVAQDGKAKPQAIRMLRGAISAPMHPDYVVEDSGAVEDAKELLARWGA